MKEEEEDIFEDDYCPPELSWDYPEFTVPEWLIKEHNILAESHKGSLATHQNMGRVDQVVRYYGQMNRNSLKLKDRVAEGKVKHRDVAASIQGLVRSFGQSGLSLINEFNNRLDMDIVTTQATGSTSGFVDPDVVQLFHKLILMDCISLPPGKKGNKLGLDKNQIRVARTLPDSIATALGIDKLKLLPANAKGKLVVLEAYQDLFGKLTQVFIEAQKYEYEGHVPSAPREVLDAGEPEVVSYDKEVHTL